MALINKETALKRVSFDTEAYNAINMIPAVDAVDAFDVLNIIGFIRYEIWLEDIPSPGNCKEYQEHHKAIQRLIKVCDEAENKIIEMRGCNYGN